MKDKHGKNRPRKDPIYWARKRTDLANHRTAWAKQRTLLANERTFSAWVRTGLASAAAGLAIPRLLGHLQSPDLVRAIGLVIILIGAFMYLMALYRYFHQSRQLNEEGVKTTPLWAVTIIITGLFASNMLLLFVVLRMTV